MSKIRVGIAGSAGYTGGELIRLLFHHPNADLVFAQSKSQAGQPVSVVHQDLAGYTALKFSENPSDEIDVLFLCLGHGEAVKYLDAYSPGEKVKVIDLSNDFRLRSNAQHKQCKFVYGLPEVNREIIRTASNIANPGCFATAIELALLPLAKKGLVGDVYVTGITGSTGAGQSLSSTSHFSWRTNNIQAYKTLTHQHTGEINETIQQLQPATARINFVPWRGDFARGIFVSAQMTVDEELSALQNLYDDYYQVHPFVYVSNEPIFLKQVINTNKCFLQLEKTGTQLVIHSAIDNLLKGASGQAVQNMNLMFGLDEHAGLHLKANYF